MKKPLDLLDHENAERLLKEGWTLFQQKGFHGASMDELCLRCNLTKPTLYYYFQNKENLFVRVLEYRLEGFHNAIDRPGTLRERLEWTAVSILESFHADYSSLMRDRENIRNPENQERIRRAFRAELFDPIKNLMASGIRAGELAEDDPELLTQVYMGILNNFIGRSREAGQGPERIAGRLVDYFLNGALKK